MYVRTNYKLKFKEKDTLHLYASYLYFTYFASEFFINQLDNIIKKNIKKSKILCTHA